MSNKVDMSWFQSTNLASFAKTALKEAQKTIDKALEINNEASASASEGDGSSLSSSTTSDKVAAAVTEAATDFFTSWGMGVNKKSKDGKPESNNDSDLAKPTDKERLEKNSAPSSKTELHHKRSISLDSKKTLGNETAALTSDIPVTLLPVPVSTSQGEDAHDHGATTTLGTTSQHHRSLSDTVFNLASDHHESVQVLDDLENDTQGGDNPSNVATNPPTKPVVRSCPNSSRTSSEFPVIDGFKSAEICGDTLASTRSSSDVCDTLEIKDKYDNLIPIDLHSSPNDDHLPPPLVPVSNDSQTLSAVLQSDNTCDDSHGSWYWSSDVKDEETSPIYLIGSVDTRNTKATTDSTNDRSTDGDSSNSFTNIEGSDSQSGSQLESSTGTVLCEVSGGIGHASDDDLPGYAEDAHNDDFDRNPTVPPLHSEFPASSNVEVPHSPPSSSPILHPEPLEDSRRGSPDHNFELLSNSSKPEDHSSRCEFLPESSRSSSIVVISARTSSGGSASTASTGSDIHNRDLDLESHQWHPHFPHRKTASEGSSCYEKVDSNQSSDPTSPEFIQKSVHRKGPSSASSSDIEVILSSEYSKHPTDPFTSIPKERHRDMTSIEQQTSLEFREQSCQTDFTDEAKMLAEELPKKITNEISDVIAEKDMMIEQLREEGEKLSKKQYDLGQVIKKLRTKEKDMEGTIKKLTGDVAGRNVENERLMKNFVNKESMEKTLSETVSRLTTEKHGLELKIEQLQSELEDAKENCASMKGSVEDASVEILELKNAVLSSQRDSTELDGLTREKSELISRNESLQKEVDSLRSTINSNHGRTVTKEKELQVQVTTLTRKVHYLEGQLADASSEVADATMPLSLEIDRLQSELKQAQQNFEKREKLLNGQLVDLQSKWKTFAEKESSLREQLSVQQATIASVETKLQASEAENRNLRREMSLREENEQKLAQDNSSKINKLESKIRKLTSEMETLVKENERLTGEIKSERASLELEKKTNQSLMEQVGRNFTLKSTSSSTNPNPNNNYVGNPKSGEHSPSSNSVVSESSYLDEVFDSHGRLNHRSVTPRGSFFDALSSSDVLEHLQNQLRLRENEVFQVQEEVRKNEKIRKTLNEEIAKMTMKNHELWVEMEKLQELQPKLQELETNYNALLQLYGEKVEEADELRLDLQDVKDMYKTQIEQLLKK